MAIILDMDMPSKCSECPFCIYSADEKRCIGYCNTSDEDYYCKVLERFMEYDKVDGGLDILGKPNDCPLCSTDEMVAEITRRSELKSNRSVLTANAYIDCLQIIDKYTKSQRRNCRVCKHSKDGHCAGTEECHECMWENKNISDV